MQIPWGKLLSLVVASAYLALAFSFKSGALVGHFVVCLVPALALIWFPEQLGSFTGWYSHGCEVKSETPAILVSIMGWIFLLGLPVLAYLLG